jgi:hypothetical protein
LAAKALFEKSAGKTHGKKKPRASNVMAGLCREQGVVSREKATRYCGQVAGEKQAEDWQAGQEVRRFSLTIRSSS